MHISAMHFGRVFFETYTQPEAKRVLDVGAMNLNGSLRSVAPERLEYVGIDMGPGKGVDIVLEDPHKYPLEDESFDIVLSTSCFEHDTFFWVSFMEMLRVARPGAYIYINVPSNGQVHRHPYDIWRFYPDAGLALAEWAKSQGVEVELVESFIGDRHPRNFWNDFVAVFRKPGPQPVTDKRISQVLTAVRNIRLIGEDKVIRPIAASEDMQIQKAQADEIVALKEKIAGLEAQLAGDVEPETAQKPAA